MRKALNDNPVVQAAAIGILALVVGFFVLTRMGGGPDPAGAPAATDSVAAPPATARALPADPAAGAAATGPNRHAPAAAGATAAFKAGPGLPEAVVQAYDQGKVVVVLIVRNIGIGDRKLRSTVQSLRARSDLAVFTTRAAKIADYSRITQGVEVSRVPALIVIRPKKLNDGPLPIASVSYGFRSEASVNQAVENALYSGPSDLPYYPE